MYVHCAIVNRVDRGPARVTVIFLDGDCFAGIESRHMAPDQQKETVEAGIQVQPLGPLQTSFARREVQRLLDDLQSGKIPLEMEVDDEQSVSEEA